MDSIVHHFRDAVAANGYLWFLEDSMNALFRINVETLKIEFVLSFPNEKIEYKRICNALAKCGDKLVCCPKFAKFITIYDTVSGKTKNIGIDFDSYEYRTVNMFGKLAVGDNVYLQRNGYSGIYQLNVQSGELCMLDIATKQIKSKDNDIVWHWKMRQYKSDTEIILYDMKQNILYQYNIETLETKKLICFEEKQRMVDFETDSCWIWLLCCDGMIYKLNGNQVIARYKCNTHETNGLELLYYKDRIYIINVLTGEIVQMLEEAVDEDFLKMAVNSTGVYSAYFGPDNCFWMQWNDGFFYYYDGVNEVSGIFESNLSDIPLEAYFPNDTFAEDKEFLLEKMLKIIKYKPDVIMNVSENQIGKTIYNTILKD